ncbi:MAG: AbrB/MazE/SpoVT family DNA-binding domain-containing protein, partial [Burkholderiales bacterium]|nr:AbrB/MazE/SpoVT family DNA-binding domain-containing protein [Burkholderiales bacterium]
KFQVVIPRDLRRLLNIQPGQKLQARIQGDHIELIPEQPITAARGFLPGIDAQVEREDDRV